MDLLLQWPIITFVGMTLTFGVTMIILSITDRGHA